VSSISLLEILERSATGPMLSENEFNMRVSKKLREVVKDYGIKFDRDILVPSDDGLVDDVFKAGMDFCYEVGTYCMDTERMIRLTEEEVKEGVKNAPHNAYFGEGKEAKAFIPRQPESKENPWCHVGAGMVVSSEEIQLRLIEGLAGIPEIDSISPVPLDMIHDVPVKGSHLQFYNSLQFMMTTREVLTRLGKPGLPLVTLVSACSSPLATISSTAPQFGIARSNGWLVPRHPELKITNDELCKTAYLLSWGANIGNEFSPLVGGYSGGPEETAVATVANSIQGILMKSNYEITWMANIVDGVSSTADALLTSAVSCQAISRNLSFPHIQCSIQAAGPFTKMLLYEIAAVTLHAVPSGQASYPHPARATVRDHMTPLEMRFSVELNHAAAGMKRSDANQMVKAVYKKYEQHIRNAPRGKAYQDCYNLKTGKPGQEWLGMYNEVKRELEDLGVPI